MSNHYKNTEKHHVAVDNIIFGFDGNRLMLLVVKRQIEPCKGEWSLMGGFVGKNESLDEAAARVVKITTGLEDVFMEQFFTYGEVDRDTEARTISVAYYTLIRVEHHDHALGQQHGARWFPLENLPHLIFDHNQMVKDALQVLAVKTRNQPVGFELLPEKFTIPQLRALYEAITGKPLDPGNFSKKLHNMKLLTRLDEKDKSQSKKGAFYYRFDKIRYEELQKEGLLFELK
ncbi:MAG: NUDIX domain-containing protein [Bacteroidia bacterium]